jgi:hypothetical protein
VITCPDTVDRLVENHSSVTDFERRPLRATSHQDVVDLARQGGTPRRRDQRVPPWVERHASRRRGVRHLQHVSEGDAETVQR